MGTSTDALNRESPEQRVGRLVAQLRNHALWDSLLIFSPPLLIAIYLAVYFYRGAWIAPDVPTQRPARRRRRPQRSSPGPHR